SQDSSENKCNAPRIGEHRLTACCCRQLADKVFEVRLGKAAETSRLAACAPRKKCVTARRDHQHTRRVRYPERARATRKEKIFPTRRWGRLFRRVRPELRTGR